MPVIYFGLADPSVSPVSSASSLEAPDVRFATFQLDDSGDLSLPLTVVRGAQAVLLKIKSRFRLFRGEWFLDQRIGVPYRQTVLVKNPDTILISAIYRKALLGTPGVARVTTFNAVLVTATRTLTCDFEAFLTNGFKIIVQAEDFIL